MRAFPIKNWKDIVALLVLVGVGVGFYLFLVKSHSPGPRLLDVGDVAPNFALPSLNAGPVSLNQYRGKVVFLNFWATWCPPCVWEMPSMEALYQRLKGRDFEILAVSIDKQGEQVVRPFVEKHGLTFPVLLDPDSQVYRTYAATGVPETFIIDKQGLLVRKLIGAQEWTTKEWLDYFDRVSGVHD